MKKSLVLAGMLLASSAAMAMDAEWFVGADASYVDADAKVGFAGTATIDGIDYSDLSADTGDKDTALGLKVGAIINKNHRASLNYAGYDFSKDGIDVDLDIVTFNYDYLFTDNNKFTPFIGIHIGQAKMEALGFDDTSTVYGLQGGVLYSITKNIEFELGIVYSKTDVKPTTPTVSGTYGLVTLTNASAYLEAEDITKAYVGINYKF